MWTEDMSIPIENVAAGRIGFGSIDKPGGRRAAIVDQDRSG
jgi:hypothetical protein